MCSIWDDEHIKGRGDELIEDLEHEFYRIKGDMKAEELRDFRIVSDMKAPTVSLASEYKVWFFGDVGAVELAKLIHSRIA